MPDLPTGTVTFLFTDVEGSTRLWERHPAAMRAATARHDALVERIVGDHGGVLVRPRGEGDSRFAVFAKASDAVAAATSLQRALTSEPWPTPEPLRVRMALHSGEADVRDGDYYGSAVNRCARLRALARGGQVLVSHATSQLASDALTDQTSLRDLGEHQLKDLTRPERVYQLVAPGLISDFSPLRTDVLFYLPAQTTSFIGRKREIAAALAELHRPEVRLLTLTGPGGSGKTRLALEVASRALADFSDGVALVLLAPITDAALVAPTIAQTLGVRENGLRPIAESVADFLRGKSCLLLLDNFEQVVAAAPLVGQLLVACPRVKVLATSRTPLRAYGEREYPLEPLVLPGPSLRLAVDDAAGFDALRLFAERARDVKPDFVLTSDNVGPVAEICRRPDGLPLAIELAAARTRILSLTALLTELEHRLTLLTSGARDAPPRQQTMRATIAWSYDLLDEPERLLFRRLGVFAGEFDLRSAAVVSSAMEAVPGRGAATGHGGATAPDDQNRRAAPKFLEEIDGLVAKNLVRVREGPAESTFRLLDTIREYALERLDESGEAERSRAVHAAHFLRVAEEAASHQDDLAWAAWLDRLGAAIDDLRAALYYFLAREDSASSLRLATALKAYWHSRERPREGLDRLAAVLALPHPADASLGHRLVRANALQAAAWLAFDLADWATVARFAGEASGLYRAAGDLTNAVRALSRLGIARNQTGDYAGARSAYEEELAIACRTGDPALRARALIDLADSATDQADVGAARAALAEGLELSRQIGYWFGVACGLWEEGRLATLTGDLDEAEASFDESLALGQRIADPLWIVQSTYGLAYLASQRGDLAGARRMIASGLTMAHERGTLEFVHKGLDHAAVLAIADGQPGRAARLAGACTALREPVRAVRHPIWKTLMRRAGAPIEHPGDNLDLAKAWDEGRAMTLEQAVAYALEDENA